MQSLDPRTLYLVLNYGILAPWYATPLVAASHAARKGSGEAGGGT